jgi:hypothetical protein
MMDFWASEAGRSRTPSRTEGRTTRITIKDLLKL